MALTEMQLLAIAGQLMRGQTVEVASNEAAKQARERLTEECGELVIYEPGSLGTDWSLALAPKDEERDGYPTWCRECGIDGRLSVVSGTFEAMGMRLGEDGFATADASQFDTDNEIVECGACGAQFPLSGYGRCVSQPLTVEISTKDVRLVGFWLTEDEATAVLSKHGEVIAEMARRAALRAIKRSLWAEGLSREQVARLMRSGAAQ